MTQRLAVVWLVVMAAFWVGSASAASPWDGEWEGEIKQQRLTCSPCKIRLTVQDGVPNIRGDVSIPSFAIDGGGQVSGMVAMQSPGFNAECSLRGQVNGNTLTARGKCIGGTEPPDLVLRRVTSSAGLPPPAATPSTSGSTRVPSNPPTPQSASAPPAGHLATPPTAEQRVFGVGTQTLRLGDLTYEMAAGDRIGEIQVGNWLTSCGGGRKEVVTRRTLDQPTLTGYQTVFSLLSRSRGYTIGGLTDNNGVSAAAYVVTARVTTMDLVGCIRENSTPPQWSGSGAMTIAWQVLRAGDGQTVYTTTTQTNSVLPTGERRTDGLAYLFATTFGDAVLQLVSTPGFRDAVRVPAATASRPRGGSNGDELVRTPPLYRGNITGNMKAILAGVVEIRPAGGTGSGFVIDASGLILTNAHVVRGSDTVAVAFADGDRVNGTVIKRDLVRDVALIRVDKTGLKPLPIRRGEPTLTEKVYAVGSPRGLSQTVTEGIVSSYRRQQNGSNLIQATAPISPGNSGGPLLDASGNVIGISEFTRTDGQNLNFFIPIESALEHLSLRLTGR